MFFPRNSFVTNNTLTSTNTSRGIAAVGNDHIVCYGGSTQVAQVTWHNSSGLLQICRNDRGIAPCGDCGSLCQGNGGVGVDPQDNEHTDIHMYTNSTAYVNQDLECRVSYGQSAFIGVYLINEGECCVLYYITACTYSNTLSRHCMVCNLQPTNWEIIEGGILYT